METHTLYDKLGADLLKRLVDTFYDFVFEDEKLKELFSKSPKEVIKQKQFLFLTQFLGGPQLYSQTYGHPQLRARHLPHQVTESGAIAWLHCMSRAINTLPISETLKDELFAAFPKAAFHMVNTGEEK